MEIKRYVTEHDQNIPCKCDLKLEFDNNLALNSIDIVSSKNLIAISNSASCKTNYW